MKKNNATYREWLDKATDDIKVAELLVLKRKTPALACFHCQQAVEKYLKAFLIYHHVNPGRIHGLVALANRGSKIEPNLKVFKEQLAMLDAYYIPTRYPGEKEPYTLKDGRVALTAARLVTDFITKRLPS